MNTRRRVTLQAGSRSGEWWRSLREVALRLDVSRCPSKVCIGAIVAVLCSSAPASAQEWLKDRQASEGPGVLVGDFELHAFAAFFFVGGLEDIAEFSAAAAGANGGNGASEGSVWRKRESALAFVGIGVRREYGKRNDLAGRTGGESPVAAL